MGKSKGASVAQQFRETFSLDLRSLGALRIALAVMVLIDLAIRSVDISDHYTDFGLLPRSHQELTHFANYPGRFSFHMMSGSYGAEAALFALQAACALVLLVGYRTRLALLANFILLVSLQNRNATIETGGDYLLRMAFFWALFLPLGARFSLDQRAGRMPLVSAAANKTGQYFSLAGVALILQISLLYVFSAIHKDHPIWRTEFTAIQYALHIDSYDTSLGEWLRQFPAVTRLMTRGTLVFETGAPFFVFGAGLVGMIPALKEFAEAQGKFRTIAVLSFMGFHLGLGMTMSLGTFAWFAIMIWVGLFPAFAWEEGARLVAKWKQRSQPPLKKKAKSRKKSSKVSESGGDAGQSLEANSSVEKTAEAKPAEAKPSEAKGALARVSRGAFYLQESFAVVCFVVVGLWNLSNVHRQPYAGIIRGESFLPDMRPLVNVVRLDQHWGLFAPYPRTSDGYYVVKGDLKNGQAVDVLTPDHKLTYEKPDDVSGSYKTFRWRKYFRDLRRSSMRVNLRLYSGYVCRSWNASHPPAEQMTRVEIIFFKRRALRAGGYKPTERERLYVAQCFQGDAREPSASGRGL